MSIETNIQTVSSFIKVWSEKPARLEPELLSIRNETNRIPDPSVFTVSVTGLIDPETQIHIKEFIRSDTPLYKKEFTVLETLENWAKYDDSDDIAVWISPPYPDKYPCAKITFSKIAYDWDGNKFLTNTTILFGDSNTSALDILPNPKITDTETLRGIIFVIDEETAIEVLNKIEVSNNIHPVNVDLSNPEVRNYINDIKNGVSASIITAKMQETGFLGSHAISCPTGFQKIGFSNFLSVQNIMSNAEKWTYHLGTCRCCHKQDTEVGPCNICKSCETKYDNGLLSNAI